jgi:molybdate transport system substrate-binding protein
MAGPRRARHGALVAIRVVAQPLRQRMVLTKRAGATARAFYGYLQEGAARAVLARYGFALPGG